MRVQFAKENESVRRAFHVLMALSLTIVLCVFDGVTGSVCVAQPSPAPKPSAQEVAPQNQPESDSAVGAKKVDGKKTPAGTSHETKRGGRGAKIEELEALVIEGKVQKPEVFYVLGRADARFVRQKLRKSFADKIVTSVKDNPF